MIFTGIGAGTLVDPYQITTVAQFKEMDGYGINSAAFTGIGLNDAVASGVYTGNGSGDYTITITETNTFKWKKGLTGVETIVIMNGGAQTLIDGVRIKFATATGYTIGDVWLITVALTYWKLMNNLDWLTEASFIIETFNAKLNGDGFSLLNMPLNGAGIGLKDGCSIDNISFKFDSRINNGITFFKQQSRALANVSITRIHFVVPKNLNGYAGISAISRDTWNSTCTINNIVIEGVIIACFTATIKCLIEHVKLLRIINHKDLNTNAPLVEKLDNATMRYCQVIDLRVKVYGIPSSTIASFLVGYLSYNSVIQECFLNSYIDIKYEDPNGLEGSIQGLVREADNDSSQTIKDSYFRGYFSVNGGELPSYYNGSFGKSGFAITSSPNVKVQRCFYFGDMNTPLNNNRTILAQDNSYHRTVNSFYNSSKIKSINPLSTIYQKGLTDAEFVVESNFTTWDFTNIWTMGTDSPKLRNNPIYNFVLPIRLVEVSSVTRINSSTVDVLLFANYTSGDIFGIDVLNDVSEIIFNSEGLLLSHVLVDITTDKYYSIRPYWRDGDVKIYEKIMLYKHYVHDGAIESIPATITEITNLNSPISAAWVHGSCLYGDYIYGSTRNIYPEPAQTGCFIKANINNVSDYTEIPIWLTSEGVGKMYGMDQIVVCGNFIYGLCTLITGPSYDGIYLVQLNPIDDTYNVFKLQYDYSGNHGEPIFTDNGLLYITYSNYTHKVDPSIFVNTQTKFNSTATASASFVFPIIASYFHDSQGGAIQFGYTARAKGFIHSACVDDNFIYLAFTTRNGTVGFANCDDNGYGTTLLRSVHELHKVNKSTMLADSWVKIPKSTDDMCQTSTHLFYGIEVSSSANVNTYGKGWGNYAIRKNDLRLTALPRYHISEFNEINPTNWFTSYASLIFGHYLLDSKTNNFTYIIDISDVDNWTITESVGKRTLKAYSYPSSLIGFTPNEFLLTDNGTFLSFVWGNPSKLMQVNLSGLNYFAIPTVNTTSSVNFESDITMTGYVIDTGGHSIESKGFKYGTEINSLINSVISNDITIEFHSILFGLQPGIYYYKAYAINSLGESTADIKSFSLLNYHWRIKAVSNGSPSYSEDQNVISFKELPI